WPGRPHLISLLRADSPLSAVCDSANIHRARERPPTGRWMMLVRRLALAFALLTAAIPAAAQYVPLHGTVIPLYPNGAPGSEARRNEPETAQDYWVGNIHNPSITWFAPDPHHANG